MTEIVSIRTATQCDKDMAEYLRELAERMDRGEIKDCVVVFNDMENKAYERYAVFEDRWRLLGALEYAKDSVHKGE